MYENPLVAQGHLLLCGHITASALVDFVHELYDMSHGKQPLPLCVLTPTKLPKKLKMVNIERKKRKKKKKKRRKKEEKEIKKKEY